MRGERKAADDERKKHYSKTRWRLGASVCTWENNILSIGDEAGALQLLLVARRELGPFPIALGVHRGGVGRAASAGTGGGARRSRLARVYRRLSGGARGGGARGALCGSLLHHCG